MDRQKIERLAGRAMAEATELMEVTWHEHKRYGGRRFGVDKVVKQSEKISLYPVTPRKLTLISSYIIESEIDIGKLQENGLGEVLRITSEKMDVLMRLVATTTLPSQECADTAKLEARAEWLSDVLEAQQVAQLFLYIFSRLDYGSFADSIGLIARANVTAAPVVPIEKERS